MKFLAFNVVVIAALLFLYNFPPRANGPAAVVEDAPENRVTAARTVDGPERVAFESELSSLAGKISALSQRMQELERWPLTVPRAEAERGEPERQAEAPAAIQAPAQKRSEPSNLDEKRAGDEAVYEVAEQEMVVVEGELMPPHERRGALLDLAQEMEERFLGVGAD